MKCNHCDKEAVHSEDFAVWATEINEEMMTHSDSQLAVTTRWMIAGQIGVQLPTIAKMFRGLARGEKQSYKIFMGFIRENCCKSCLRRELVAKIKKSKKHILICLLPALIGIIGMILTLAKTVEIGGSSKEINTLLYYCSICLCIALASIIYIAKKAIDMFKYKRIDLDGAINPGVFPHNFSDAFKAPLYNLRSVKDHYQLGEKHRHETIDLENENRHNEFPAMLLSPFTARCIILPIKKVMKQVKIKSDTDIADIRKTYEQLTNGLTDEMEEARAKLLHSR
ncbi:MAG: hypothetical protein LBN04_09680 [Oscillospiraceae bacterium]|jgi:hypothetical protein|nr:hypothetical protein [Oscillospiraceae bacterium]